MLHPDRPLRKLTLALVFTALIGSAGAVQALPRIYIPVPPPPPIVEVRPVAPGPRHIWIEGYHRWDNGAYTWVPGHWERRPRAHSVWVRGHYVHGRRGWYWVPGRWRR